MQRALAICILIGVVMPALIILIAGLSNLARWGGYGDALPLIALVVLYLIGHFITASLEKREQA